MPTYDIEGVGKFTSDSELSEAELGQLIDQHSAPSAAGGIGELRRREGTGQIDAGIEPPYTEADLTNIEDLKNPELMANRVRGAKQQAALAAGILVPELVAPALGLTAPAAAGTGLAMRTLRTAGQLAATGAISGAAAKTAERVVGELSGEHESLPQTAKEIATETGVGALAGPAVGALGQVVKGVSRLPVIRGLIPAAKEAFTPGPDYLGRIGAGYFRRVSTPAQEGLSAARSAIESITGEKVPVSVGEAIGNPAIAEKLGVEDKALNSEDFEALKRLTLMTAAKLKGIKVSPTELADETIGVLGAELGRVSKPAREAIAKVSAEIHPAIETASREVEEASKKLIPGTAATGEVAGQRLQSSVRQSFSDISDEVTKAYDEVITHPDYPTVPVQLKNAKTWLNDIASSTLQRKGGTPIAGAMPPTLPQLVDTIEQADPVQSLDAIRKLRTRVYDSIGNDTIFPGTSDYEKGKLARALTGDIDDAVSSLPTSDLKTKLQDANRLYSQKMERFKGKPVEQFLAEFGGEGGPTAEALANRLTGTGGNELIGALKKAAGPREGEVVNTVREFLFNNAAEAGRDITTKTVSAGKILGYIENKLSPELQKEFFPNLEKVRALALRESKIAGLESAAPKILKSLQIEDPALLYDALGPTASKSVTDRVADAFKKSAALDAQLNGSILGALKSSDAEGLATAIAKNPQHFVDGILDGSFGIKQTQKAADLIGRENPDLFKKMQFRYVDTLLNRYGNSIDAAKLAKDLSSGTDTTGIGKVRELSRTFLGDKVAGDLEEVLKGLATFDKSRTYVDPRTPMIAATMKALGEVAGASGAIPRTGAVGGGTLFSSMARYLQNVRYDVAASILTTPELRQLARTPVSRITPEQWQSVFRTTANAIIGTKIAEDSPEAETLKRLSQ